MNSTNTQATRHEQQNTMLRRVCTAGLLTAIGVLAWATPQTAQAQYDLFDSAAAPYTDEPYDAGFDQNDYNNAGVDSYENFRDRGFYDWDYYDPQPYPPGARRTYPRPITPGVRSDYDRYLPYNYYTRDWYRDW